MLRGRGREATKERGVAGASYVSKTKVYSLSIRHENLIYCLGIRFYYSNLSDYRKGLCIFGVKFRNCIKNEVDILLKVYR